MSERRGILTLDVEEWFHAHNYLSKVAPSSWDERPRRAGEGVDRLLRLCDEEGIRATWFVLGWTAERDPSLVREIASAGHEIGCHTYAHPVTYDLSPDEFRDDLRRGRDAVASALGQAPLSYRAASFTIVPRCYWALDILREEGFRVDSSLFPVAHSRYGNPRGPRRPFRLGRGDDEDLLVLPMPTLRVPGRNLPFAGGAYFRLLPLPVVRAVARWVQSVQGDPVVYYFHPWELDSYQPDVDLGRWQNLRSQGGKRDLFAKLQRALRGQMMGTVQEWAESVRDTAPVYSDVAELPPRGLSD
jgi:polysaccharide deacetylase family protein (PEP-CTERM system associated)